MRKIAILNQKGGVGKTTTAVNLSAALANQGRRVCLVDMDPQAHATLHTAGEIVAERPSMYDLLAGRAEWDDVVVRLSEQLWLAGSHIDLAALEVELAGVPEREAMLRCRLVELADRFDEVIVDCPPSLGILSLNALAAVDEVVVPLQPHFLALHGLSQLLQTIEQIADWVNPQLRIAGVVLCMYDQNTRLAAEVRSEIQRFLAAGRGRATPWAEARLLEPPVRRNIRLAEAPSFGQTIFEYAPHSHGAEDYSRLAAEFLLPNEPAGAAEMAHPAAR